ncbi:MAG: CPCC family cysteine-rich protein [Pseudomonas prosekii]
MRKISRSDATHMLSKQALASLDNNTRESLLLNWWGIDDSDEEFSLLSKEMQELLVSNDEPPSDVQNPLYDELLLIALYSEYKGVTNSYLSTSMKKMGLGEHEVVGFIEPLETCPCCGYRTLSSRANYEICDLCRWEDSGVVDPEQYSGPNHMTLGEAKAIFAKSMSTLPLDKWAI